MIFLYKKVISVIVFLFFLIENTVVYADQSIHVKRRMQDEICLHAIDHSRIARYKTEIARMMWINKCQRIGLIATAAAITVGGIYKLFSTDVVQEKVVLNSEEITKKVTTTAADVTVAKKLLEDIAQKIGIEMVQKPICVAPQTVSYATSLFDWTKSIGRSIRDQLVTVGLMGLITGPFGDVWNWGGRSLQRLYHAGDFLWFVSKKTYVVKCFDELVSCVQELALSLDDKEREHKQKAASFAVALLAQEVEKIIAFMEYQSEQVHALYPRYAILMKSSARAITGKLDVFIKEISILLNDSKKHAELVTYVESFREKLRKEQDTFCLYENAALWDISDFIR